jgi:molybdopterin-guanine dinucleotide biosynthesis protein A
VTRRDLSAIVLAGGRSRRFGRDKLAEPIDGIPLLRRAVDSVQSLADEVIVVLAPGAERDLPVYVQVVHDTTAFDGPLVGLLAGLQAARHDIALVIGGDMPSIQPQMVDALVDALATSAVGTAAVLEVGGRPRPLPLVVRTHQALEVGTSLVQAGDRRLGALPETLDAAAIPEAEWRMLDPLGQSVLDVDLPSDLP